MKQNPTVKTDEQAQEVLKADGMNAGSGVAGFLNGGWATQRNRRLGDETVAQAKARWTREREIERDRDDDPRLVSNRVLPVRYD